MLTHFSNTSFWVCLSLWFTHSVYLLYALCCRNAFQHELTLLEKVRHPNVVQFIGAVTQKMPMMIVLEYHSKVIISLYMCIYTPHGHRHALILLIWQSVDIHVFVQVVIGLCGKIC